MAQDGDQEMPDASAGADATTNGVEFVREKQRLRLVWRNLLQQSHLLPI